MSPSIVIDSDSSVISYDLKSLWTMTSDSSMYGGSYMSIKRDANQTTTSTPMLTFNFPGSAVHFYGRPTDDLRLNYTLDFTAVHPADTSSTKTISGKTGGHLWGLDNLPDRSHTISLIPAGGELVFDYAIVTPTTSTYLATHTLVVDDTDPVIKYAGGGWTSRSGTQFPGGISFNNTQHGSSKQGDTFTFDFVGRSIAVYGLLNQQAGKLSSTYSIDGGPATTFTAYNGTQASSQDTWALHQKFFSADVTAGRHTLTVTVGEVTGSQMFWLDYISFVAIDSTRLSPAPAPLTPSSTSSGGISTYRIIGSVVGIIAFLLVAAFCLAMRRRRRKGAWGISQGTHQSEHYKPDVLEAPTGPQVLYPPSQPMLPAVPYPDFGQTHAIHHPQAAADAWASQQLQPYPPAAPFPVLFSPAPISNTHGIGLPAGAYTPPADARVMVRQAQADAPVPFAPPPASDAHPTTPPQTQAGAADAPPGVLANHADTAETAALRDEVDRLRRENARIRAQETSETPRPAPPRPRLMSRSAMRGLLMRRLPTMLGIIYLDELSARSTRRVLNPLGGSRIRGDIRAVEMLVHPSPCMRGTLFNKVYRPTLLYHCFCTSRGGRVHNTDARFIKSR
ncbi:hypothetical protein LshimejAT787_2001250 [Lyophyllum shimeji]|uniref:Transmembrane protein n=1 Tax=Lyophyllum shimeji TaxID=47721 RepID=A0A9P3UUX5_LYOSH|nr:hypothetical protein LshimejAT787_2001250 [Lyophyllum shimeji]